MLDHATVAIEDEHFYEHGGIDYGAIVRAGWEDLKAGAAVQGGLDNHPASSCATSTSPTQRRRSSGRSARRPGRREYEREYSNRQILTKYLNTASYGTTDGRTAVGVQAAAGDLTTQSRSRSWTCPRRR